MTNISSIYELQNKTLQIVNSYSNSCRLCLKKKTDEKFISLFQQSGVNLPNYSNLAMSFAKLQVKIIYIFVVYLLI